MKSFIWATEGRGGLPQNTPNLILSSIFDIFVEISFIIKVIVSKCVMGILCTLSNNYKVITVIWEANYPFSEHERG